MKDSTLKQKLLAKRNPNHRPHKLTPQQARDIVERYADGETQTSLAALYGVTVATVQYHIGKVLNG